MESTLKILVKKESKQKNKWKVTGNIIFHNKTNKVKILGNGVLMLKLDIEANAFSKSAEAAITELGGTILKI